jgi:hypothetical protein
MEETKELLVNAVKVLEKNVEYADALYERNEGVAIARASNLMNAPSAGLKWESVTVELLTTATV